MKVHAVAIALVICLAFTLTALAQPGAPYFVVSAGDLYAISPDGARQRLTERPDNRITAWYLGDHDVHPSPDGRYLIYRDAVEFAADAWNNNETGNIAELPSDLFLIDVASGTEVRIAAHAAGTTWNSGQHLYRTTYGHAAAWSPDSRAFAYIESETGTPVGTLYRLIVYEVATDSSRALREWDQDALLSQRLQWTANGLQHGTVLYAPDDTVRAEVYLHEGLYGDYPVHLDGRAFVTVEPLAMNVPDGMIYLLDLQTGDYYQTAGYVSVVSSTSPQTSLVFVDYTNDTRPAEGVYTQAGAFVFGATRTPPYPVAFVIAPDGTRFAYDEAGVGARGSVIASASGEERVSEDTIVGWGDDLYTVFDPNGGLRLQTTTQFETAAICGNQPAAGLVRGGSGHVLGDTPNRLRSAPRLDAEIVGAIPAGAAFTVVDGQQGVCSGAARWAQVTYDGRTGWTAEGADGALFVASG